MKSPHGIALAGGDQRSDRLFQGVTETMMDRGMQERLQRRICPRRLVGRTHQFFAVRVPDAPGGRKLQRGQAVGIGRCGLPLDRQCEEIGRVRHATRWNRFDQITSGAKPLKPLVGADQKNEWFSHKSIS